MHNVSCQNVTLRWLIDNLNHKMFWKLLQYCRFELTVIFIQTNVVRLPHRTRGIAQHYGGDLVFFTRTFSQPLLHRQLPQRKPWMFERPQQSAQRHEWKGNIANVVPSEIKAVCAVKPSSRVHQVPLRDPNLISRLRVSQGLPGTLLRDLLTQLMHRSVPSSPQHPPPKLPWAALVSCTGFSVLSCCKPK